MKSLNRNNFYQLREHPKQKDLQNCLFTFHTLLLCFFSVRWIAKNQAEPKTVGLPYTPKQLFWVSFAQTWCTKYRDEKLKQQILTGVHSPSHFRVLGSVSNVEDFAIDYNCPIGSKMNPVTRCSVW